MLAIGSFFNQRSGKQAGCPTKRAPDAGDSAQISSIFLRLSIFLVGRLRRPRPSAGNANRWAASQKIQIRSRQISFVGWIYFFSTIILYYLLNKNL
jgi:hypothetical protein